MSEMHLRGPKPRCQQNSFLLESPGRIVSPSFIKKYLFFFLAVPGLVAEHAFSLPDWGLNLGPLRWEGEVSAPGLPGASQGSVPVFPSFWWLLTFLGSGSIIMFCFVFFFWPHQGACRILVPLLGMEPGPWAVEMWCADHWTTREFPAPSFWSLPLWSSCPLLFCSQGPPPASLLGGHV